MDSIELRVKVKQFPILFVNGNVLLNNDKAEWHCRHIWNVQSSAKYKIFLMKEGLRKQTNKQIFNNYYGEKQIKVLEILFCLCVIKIMCD